MQHIQDLGTLDRTQTINALRPFLQTKWFLPATKFSTPVLKGLLAFYAAGGKHDEIEFFKKDPERVWRGQ